jgi:lipoprotein-anchoring transpeptidase ErfK/SrfK
MVRFRFLLSLALVTCLFASSAQASGRTGELGGGLIEFLFSGGAVPENSSGRQSASHSTNQGAKVFARARAIMVSAAKPVHPQVVSRFDKQIVDYAGTEKTGTIVIDTSARFLYLVQGEGKALRYGVGVGRPGFEWAGRKIVTRKAEWPDWRPPAEMLQRRPDLPVFMAGGPKNPLGARALYLGSSLYRIHGSNEPHTIGQAVSSGCIRMRNDDVIDLYERVTIGTEVIVR